MLRVSLRGQNPTNRYGILPGTSIAFSFANMDGTAWRGPVYIGIRAGKSPKPSLVQSLIGSNYCILFSDLKANKDWALAP
jgi:hypothetical protein